MTPAEKEVCPTLKNMLDDKIIILIPEGIEFYECPECGKFASVNFLRKPGIDERFICLNCECGDRPVNKKYE